MKSIIASILVAVSASASGADITVDKDNKWVALVGTIVPGDFEKFKKSTQNVNQGALLILTSDGGTLIEALMIGEYIRAKKFNTGVPVFCASACSLIWVAGSVKFLYTESKLGFHAAYSKETEQVTSTGNAWIGAYLRDNGMSYPAIAYMTDANPRSMNWLSKEKSLELGIVVNYITNEE